MQRALHAIEEGAIGRLAYAAWKFTGGHYPERQPSLAHLLYMQSHGFNILSVVGGEVAEVTCVGCDPRQIGSLTTAAVTMRFAGGGIGVLLASVDASYRYPRIYSLEVVGSGGRLLVDDPVGAYMFHPAESQVGEVWTPGFFEDDARSFAASTERHIAAFVDALLLGQPIPIPAEEGLTALILGTAAARACVEGGSVRPCDLT
jgi:predicted dehydrogenase